MIVTHLSLTDFRNYRSAELPLARGANLLVGSNGQGKTNLVESIGFLSTLSSHRVSTDQALVRSGAESAVVRARLEHAEREVLLELQINRSSPNRAQVNRAAAKPRDLPRYLASVLFAPEDLALVRGEPAGRRRFLDELLVLRSPRLSAVMSDYDRVLRQRNTLLKSARATRVKPDQLGTLEIWDERLVDLGTQLVVARAALVVELLPEIRSAYDTIVGADHDPAVSSVLSVLGADPDEDAAQSGITRRLDSGEVADWFRSALVHVRRAELERGVTLVGPHRDDLLLTLNRLPARGYASHGESWSLALALRLASAQLLRRDSAAGDPVLMLDDVFAELDENRRGRLSGAVEDFEQVIVTAAVLDDVPDGLRGSVTRIRAGEIEGSLEVDA